MTSRSILFLRCLWIVTSEIVHDLPCNIHLHNGQPVTVNCQNRNLTELPKRVFSKDTTDINLSRNNFPVIEGRAFAALLKLRKLNISQCNIEKLSRLSFDGLVSLEELDMKNNPVIQSGFPEGLFQSIPRLKLLCISGYAANDERLSQMGTLENLEEIVITPDLKDMPSRLAALKNLRRVYFVFCRGERPLTSSMMRPFRRSRLEELAFVSCDITGIETGAFDDLPSLRVLNLADSSLLSFDDVIDALSSSRNVTVSTLILDALNRKLGAVVLGQRERPTCRAAWANITRLSVRGTNILGINRNFMRCVPNLRDVAIGWNPAILCGRTRSNCAIILSYVTKGLVYLDISHMRYSDTHILNDLSGYSSADNWIKRNEDYFALPIGVHVNESRVVRHDPVAQLERSCTNVFIPPNLIYIIADHMVGHISSTVKYKCYRALPNSLRYLNISNGFISSKTKVVYNPVIFGLTHLEVVDVSSLGLQFMHWELFHNFPSLRILNLGRNCVGHGDIKTFPRLMKLEELDLSQNDIRKFPQDVFSNLVALRRLNVARNKLKSFDVLLPDALAYLDLSGNMLISLDGSARIRFDALSLSINIDNSPLECYCPELDFVRWFQRTPVKISNRSSMTCQQQSATYLIKDIDTTVLAIKCGLTVNVLAISTVSSSLVLLMITAALMIYRYRWILRWKYYKLRYPKHRNSEMLLTPNKRQYSAYVIYAENDEASVSWVTEYLLPGVEQNLAKQQMFVKGRDNIAGETEINEAVRGIMMSTKAMWIVCPAFFQDKLCETEANFAFHHLGAKHNLLVILDNRFQSYSVPRRFASLVHPNVTTARVRLADNEESRELFWAKLDSYLPPAECPDAE